MDDGRFLSKTAAEAERSIPEKESTREEPQGPGDDFRLVVENASQGIVIAQESTIRYTNPKITDYTGYTRQELTSRPFIELIHPDDRLQVISLHQDVLSAKVQSGHLSHRIIDKKGRVRWMDVTGVPFTWDDTASTLLFITEITERKEFEDRLRESEERYRDLIEKTGDLIYVMDGRGNFKLINQTIEREYGYAASELLGKGFTSIMTPESYKAAREDYKKQLKGIDVGNLEYDLYDKSGQIKTIETKEQLVRDGDRVAEVYGIARDVTDRKRAEAALRESEEKYRSLVENLNDAICSTDLEGCVTYVSPVAEQIIGYRVEEITGRPITDFIYSDDLPIFLESYQKTISGQKEPLEFRAVHKNGDIIHVRTFSRRQFSNGTLVGLTGTITDITDRVRAQDSMRESEEKYRLVLENAGEGIAVALGEYFAYVNPKMTEFTGYAREELAGKPIMDFIYPDDRAEFLDEHNKLMEGTIGSTIITHRFIDKDGNIKWAEDTAVPIIWDGQRAALVFVKDVTRKKETLAKLEESEEKYRLVVENADEIMGVTVDGVLRFVNRKALTLFGYAEDELVGTRAIDYVHPDDRLPLLKHWMKITNGEEKSRRFVMRTATKDGNTVWTENSIVPIQWQGKPASLNIATDITERKRIEDALKESEEKYRIVVENANEIISVTVDGNLAFVNSKTLELSGYTEEEMLGTPAIEYVHPEDHALLLAHRKKRERGEKADETLVMRHIAKDGNILWTENSIVPILWQGKPAALNIATDITGRKQIADALKESEEKYRLLIENASEGITIAQDGVTRYANPMFAKLLGYSVEELTYRPFTDFLHPDDRQLVLDHHLNRLSFREKPTVYTFRAVSKAGNIVWFENNAVIITWGEKPATLNFFRDITEQKEIEDTLRESEEKYRLVVENAREIIVITQDGFVKFANKGVMTLFGVPPETLIGKHLSDLVIKRDRDRLRLEYQKLESGEEVLPSYRYRMRDGKGKICFIEVNGITITWEGHPSVLSFVTDITEKVRAEEGIERRLRYKKAIAFCSQELVGANDLDATIRAIVNYLIETIDVGGVFICRNIMDPVEGLCMLTVSEAITEGHRPPLSFPVPDKVPYKYRSKEMLDALSNGRPFGGPTKDYPQADRNLLTLIGSRSSIMIPIFVDSAFWGFIGFDDYQTERVWDEQDILLLQTLSSMIGTIIARKGTETALTESEQRYRELVDSTGDIIYVADYKGTIKFLNNAVRRLGYEPNDLIGKNINDFYAPSSEKYAQELFRMQRAGAQLRGYELDIVRKDGQVRTMEFREELVWEGDRIIEVRGIGRDVTDRKKMEDRLRLVAESQEAVLNSMNNMVLFVDLTLKITWVNRAASSLTGFSIEELVGRYCYDVLHQREAPCEGCPAVASLASGLMEKNDSMPYLGKNRRITAYPVPDISGNVTGIAVSVGSTKSRHFLDISESLSNLDDDIEGDNDAELFLAPLDPNYIYPFSLSIDFDKDTFNITLRWEEYLKEHLLKRLARSESAVARFIYLAARMKTDGRGWVDKDLIRAGTMDTNLNKLRSLLEESNVPFLDRFSSRMLIRSNKEEKKKVRLALSASNIEISQNIKDFRSKKHRYTATVSKKIKALERELGKPTRHREYLISELTIQRQNEANLRKSIEVVETLIGESAILLGF